MGTVVAIENGACALAAVVATSRSRCRRAHLPHATVRVPVTPAALEVATEGRRLDNDLDVIKVPTCAFIIGTAATRPGGNVEKSHPNRLAGIGSHVHVTLRPARGIGRHSTQVGPVAPRAADRVPHRNMHLAPVTAGVGKPLLEAQMHLFGNRCQRWQDY